MADADRSVSCLVPVSTGPLMNCRGDRLEPCYRTTQNLQSDPVWWACLQGLPDSGGEGLELVYQLLQGPQPRWRSVRLLPNPWMDMIPLSALPYGTGHRIKSKGAAFESSGVWSCFQDHSWDHVDESGCLGVGLWSQSCSLPSWTAPGLHSLLPGSQTFPNLPQRHCCPWTDAKLLFRNMKRGWFILSSCWYHSSLLLCNFWIILFYCIIQRIL